LNRCSPREGGFHRCAPRHEIMEIRFIRFEKLLFAFETIAVVIELYSVY
jgi:hypothetical protein